MSNELNPINSPCIRNCCLNEQDVCLGCFRSLEEIQLWSRIDHKQRLKVLLNAEKRKQTRHFKL